MAKFIEIRDNAKVVVGQIHKKQARYIRYLRRAMKKEAEHIKEDLLTMISATDHPREIMSALRKKGIGYAPGMRPPHSSPIIHMQTGTFQTALKSHPIHFHRRSPHEFMYEIGFDLKRLADQRGPRSDALTVEDLLKYLRGFPRPTKHMIAREFFKPVLKRSLLRYQKAMEEAMNAATRAPE